MTSSCSTTLFAPSLPMKIVPYIPKACKLKPKPKPTSKAKSIAITKTAEHSRSGVDSKDGGEWPHIDDDFTMPGSNASLPTLHEASEASHSAGYGLVDAFARFHGASGLESPEHDQFGGESLDKGGADYPTRVTEGDLAIIGLLGGISQGRLPRLCRQRRIRCCTAWRSGHRRSVRFIHRGDRKYSA
ncbi:hypothetical protein BU23DRAFT_153769 [Bimuria novae-zelandiae CBS 107.79]|uniref:Uncharacterized protein n=1 Tax=Bimuria novae-zelandiae CBS 107.79 TaxID=1447943 RepID=A0A6A5VS22_9PLEO|nr:hypothetical protein BU23DRAFT_153769 [Bimuria novae-zelandiae CBS 107.79]